MKALCAIFFAAVLSFSLESSAAPASDPSVEKLLELTQAGKMMDSAFAQMDGLMKATMKQVTNGKPLTVQDQAVMDKQQSRMVALLKTEFSWDKMKDAFAKIYRETFTQEEVDGLIAFYQSPVGQAFVKKQPQLMQQTMQVMQQRMGPLMQKIQKMAEETAKDMKAAKSEQ